MTGQEALIALNMAGGVGSMRLKKLLDHFGTAERVLRGSEGQLAAVAGLPRNVAANIRAFSERKLTAEIAGARKKNITILTLADEAYPQQLKTIPDPPIVLYVKGGLRREDERACAIVGSRRASMYGLSQAERLSFELAHRGFTIVSGCALGIDAAAHRGALKAGGRTIAVMGCGLEHVYPAEHKKLADAVSRQGAVISEFPLGMRPLRQNFPCRNRIISGLSLGVVIAEAARKSGALITADCALEQGREVFALPGRIDSLSSWGAHEMIKQGAKLVTSVDDIIEEFDGYVSEGTVRPADRRVPCRQEQVSLHGDADQALVYQAVGATPVSWDEIIERTQMHASRLSEALLYLRLKKLITQLPGKQFVRANDEAFSRC